MEMGREGQRKQEDQSSDGWNEKRKKIKAGGGIKGEMLERGSACAGGGGRGRGEGVPLGSTVWPGRSGVLPPEAC